MSQNFGFVPKRQLGAEKDSVVWWAYQNQIVQTQAYKYYLKILTEDAISINLLKTFNIADFQFAFSNIYTSLFGTISLYLVLTLKIPPSLFDNLQLNYQIQLPDIEDIDAGIYIIFKQLSFSDIFPLQSTVNGFLTGNILPQFTAGFAQCCYAQFGVARFGQCTYYPPNCTSSPSNSLFGYAIFGESVYDPPFVTDFLINVTTRLFNIFHGDLAYLDAFKGMRKGVKINDGLAGTHFNRLSAIRSAQKQVFMLGFSVLGYSFMSEDGVISHISYDGQTYSYPIKYYDDITYCLRLSQIALGYGYLCAETKDPHPTSAFIFPEPFMTKYIRQNIESQRLTQEGTAIAFANYQPPDQLNNFFTNIRVNSWIDYNVIRYFVYMKVSQCLKGLITSAIELSNYWDAGLNLVDFKFDRHFWGIPAMRQATDEEYYHFWLRKWEAEGLNSAYLERVYRCLKPWLKTLQKMVQKVNTQAINFSKMLKLAERTLNL